ncbi:phosphopantetheine-binding protein [Pseudomonas sp. RL_5y_Pfl2_73]
MKLLSDYFLSERQNISRNSRLIEDLSADSVDIVELVMIFEGAFNIELSSGQIAGWRTVSDIVNTVMEEF